MACYTFCNLVKNRLYNALQLWNTFVSVVQFFQELYRIFLNILFYSAIQYYLRSNRPAIKPLMRLLNEQKFFRYLCPIYFICDPKKIKCLKGNMLAAYTAWHGHLKIVYIHIFIVWLMLFSFISMPGLNDLGCIVFVFPC